VKHDRDQERREVGDSLIVNDMSQFDATNRVRTGRRVRAA
jgi:hypothetical protein